jgi:putative protease
VKKPELLSPGGSFLSAYYALEGGADGVYLGLKEFSARKAAQNFSLEQLRRIRRLAADRGKRVYVTVNTIIQEEELPQLLRTFAWLEALAVDGVIVQDLGACEILARRFPRIPIHASTQMAVHNDAGLRMAEELGIRRVILSRELTLERIRGLRERHPGIELEVFIHGALCYSFSGVCLASSALTGRSANRGDCAQICRSLFHDESGECEEGRPSAIPRRQERQGSADLGVPAYGHFFSCRDLFLGREILKLAEIGVDALKIEGRMKSPEYAFNVTRLYRQILDSGGEMPEEEYEELVRRAEITFAREKTTGWQQASSGLQLIGQRYPGHRGSFLGTVDSISGREMRLRLAADLSVRDGIGFFREGAREPVIFSVSRIRSDGRETRFARTGEVVSIEVPSDAGGAPEPGAEIRHLSSRFLDLPQPKETGFPLYRVSVDLRVSISKTGVFSARAAEFPLFARTVTVERAARKRPFMEIIAALLAESGESLFTLGHLAFTNETGFPDDEIFVPPSQMKKAKNELYAFLEEAFPKATDATEDAVSWPAPEAFDAFTPSDRAFLAHRQALSPPCRQDQQGSPPIPFVCSDPAAIGVEDLVLHAGFRWLPLPPVMLDDDKWLEALHGLVERHHDTRFAVGLNNLAHCAIASSLADHENVSFFADFYMYAANSRTLAFIRERVPRLLFAFAWIEEGGGRGKLDDGGTVAAQRRGTQRKGGIPVVRIAPDFRAPLFYSLGCFARHVSGGGKCFEGCPKDFTRELRQGRNRFQLVVRDCVTYLFASAGK